MYLGKYVDWILDVFWETSFYISGFHLPATLNEGKFKALPTQVPLHFCDAPVYESDPDGYRIENQYLELVWHSLLFSFVFTRNTIFRHMGCLS